MDALCTLLQTAKDNRASLILNAEEQILITVDDVEMFPEGVGCGQCDSPMRAIVYISGNITAPYLSGTYPYQGSMAKHYVCKCTHHAEKYEEDEFLFKGSVDHPKCVCDWYVRTSEMTVGKG